MFRRIPFSLLILAIAFPALSGNQKAKKLKNDPVAAIRSRCRPDAWRRDRIWLIDIGTVQS